MRLFRSAPLPVAPLACRMSADEVLRVARGVVAGDGGSLYVRGARQTPNGVEWRVEARVIGRRGFVRIDDATGAVLEAGRYPTR